MPGATPIVELRAIAKVYEEAGRPHPVLRGVDLAIAEGEFAAIQGRSGSGKTTVLNLIAGIDLPTQGQVIVAGVDLTRLAERQRTLFRRHHIGFVYQFFNLIPTLSVVENVQLPLELQGRWAECRPCAMELLRRTGLDDRCDSFPDRLSGGEQQRVAIARALASAPQLVLADEPTGNLDAETGDRVLDLLVSLSREGGRTLIVATHSRSVAARADRVLHIEGTGIAEVADGLAAQTAPDPEPAERRQQ